jgi:hypothetical protein
MLHETRKSREEPGPLQRPATAAVLSTRGVATAELPVVLHETMAVADLDAAEQDLERWDGLS